jgi:hypothetical protein
MSSIYDDIIYIETLNNMKGNKSDDENENIIYSIIEKDEDENDDEQIIEYLHRKKMFQKLLNETLKELNKTNPCLEPFKYHTLCLYTNRYNRFINNIINHIKTIEFKKLQRRSLGKRKYYKDWTWYWSWKTISFILTKDIQMEKNDSIEIVKNMYDKKRD